MLLTAAVALASDCSGRWQGKLTVGDNEMPGYLVLKQDGAQVTGTMGPDAQKQIALKSGSAAGDEVTIEASPGPSVLKLVLHPQDGKLTGDVFEDGNKIGSASFGRASE
jgi:hypothetical protein